MRTEHRDIHRLAPRADEIAGVSDLADALVDGQHAQDLHERGLGWREVAREVGYPVEVAQQLARNYLAHRHTVTP